MDAAAQGARWLARALELQATISGEHHPATRNVRALIGSHVGGAGEAEGGDNEGAGESDDGTASDSGDDEVVTGTASGLEDAERVARRAASEEQREAAFAAALAGNEGAPRSEAACAVS